MYVIGLQHMLTSAMLNSKMPNPLLILSPSDYLIQLLIQSHILIDKHCRSRSDGFFSWLLLKPTDLDRHCLQRQGISLRAYPDSAGSGVVHPILLPGLMFNSQQAKFAKDKCNY